MTSTSVARALSRADRRRRRPAPRPPRRRPRTPAPSAVRRAPHRPERSTDLDDGIGALLQDAALDVAQRRLARAGDVALVARDQLFGDPACRGRRRPEGRPARRRSTRRRAGAATAWRPASRSCAASRDPDVFDGALAIEVVERREVVGRRRQRQAGATGDGAVPDGVEAAFAQQVGGRADQRVPSSFSLGSDCCRHALHAASNGAATLGFRLITHGQSSAAPAVGSRGGMMARMPELSRRAVLRLGVGAAAGAAGAYALGPLLDPRSPSARDDDGVGAPLAPPAPLAPSRGTRPPTYVTGSFVSAARGGVQTNWAIARPPGQTAPLRPVIALHGKGSDAADGDGGRRRAGPGAGRRGRHCRRSRSSPSTAAEATGTSAPPARTPARWCSTS